MNDSPNMTTLSSLRFDNRFTHELPADPVSGNSRRQVAGACFSRVSPTPVAAPKLVAWSREMADLLGLTEDVCQSDEFTQVFAGNRILSGMDPFAMCYGGHQFGSWAGQLGDGRAINLGEVINDQKQRWTLQLKGAGPTPYSRTADGLAVLRSSVREFLCSEAMHHLGVPTTRALSLILTGESVVRDMFYDGHPREEFGAVVCRVAPSFVRFGNFQIHAARRDTETLRKLAEYTILTDFPHLGPASPETCAEWFREVCVLTAKMIVHWQRVGFVHGVMNTDNMSILGLTIDYGPYGWLDNFDPNWTPNTTDASTRRYRFGQQPQVALWNLIQLANSLVPLVTAPAELEAGLAEYTSFYQRERQRMMADKLGLETFDPETDEDLISELLTIMQLAETDMTIFFRSLTSVSPLETGGPSDTSRSADLTALPESIMNAYYAPHEVSTHHWSRIQAWFEQYRRRLQRDNWPPESRRKLMNQVNPKYVLRNYLAQEAIDLAEQGDFSRICELLELLRHPYDEQPGHEHFASRRPEWARQRPGCSTLSCSS